MKVHLAYAPTDEKGETHAPDTDVTVNALEGRRLVTEGKGQEVDESASKDTRSPVRPGG